MATNGSTYNFVAQQTISGATSVTFNNIPQNYTDLVMVVNAQCATNDNSAGLQFNGDLGTNYSFTFMNADGTSATGAHYSGQTVMQVGLMNNANWSTSIYHIQNYSSTNMYKTVIGRGNMSNLLRLYSSTWKNSSAVTSITVVSTPNSYNFLTGSTITLYGIKAADTTAIIPTKAIGGDAIVTDGTYTYHAFKSTGAFTPATALTADVMVIAGGGSGAFNINQASGGGGAGGFRLLTSQSLIAGTSYFCTIGAGGASVSTSPSSGRQGTNSSIIGGAISISATGGGGGGYGTSGGGATSGGSGGGAGSGGQTGASGNAGGYTPVEGYAGGNSVAVQASGGGGGAGGIGGNGGSGGGAFGGNGGVGAGGTSYTNYAIINAIGAATLTGQYSSSNWYYAGGGGASADSGSTGGLGGGGNGPSGSATAANSGTTNTGGGGSGAYSNSSPSGAGGSGIVIVRYLS